MKNKPSLSRFHLPVPIFLLLAFFALQAAVLAADYYPPRISYLDGRGAYEPAGDVDWDEVTVNLPLLNGDRIFSQADSRIEVDFGKENFLRLGPETDVAFVQVDGKETVLELHTGAVILRVNDSEKFRIYTPAGPVFINKKGLYRIGLDTNGATEVVVRKGRAEFSGPQGTQRIENGQRALIDSAQGTIVNVSYGYAEDSFDVWSSRRDARLVSSRSVAYVGGTYYPGVYDLDYYGSWVNYPSYGTVWVPNVSVGWVPFRNGFWVDFSFGWGWTWVSYEPWGYLPYHYGAWRYYNSRWCWVPGGFHHWTAAPVHFYHSGGYVGWYPRNNWNNWNNTTIVNNTTIINNISRPGLTVVRDGDFGRTRINQVALNHVPESFSSNVRGGLPESFRNRSTTHNQDRAITSERSRSLSAGSRSAADRASSSFTERGSSPSGPGRSVVRTPSAERSVPENRGSTNRSTVGPTRSESRSGAGSNRTVERPPVRSPSPSRSTQPRVAPQRSAPSRVAPPSSAPSRSTPSRPSSRPNRPDRPDTSVSSNGVINLDRNNFSSRSIERPNYTYSSPSSASPASRSRGSVEPYRYPTREMVTPPSAARSTPTVPRSTVSPNRPSSRSWSTPSSRSIPSYRTTPSYRSSRPSISSRPSSPSISRPSVSRPSSSISRPPTISRPAPSRPSYHRSSPMPSRPSPSRPSSSPRPPRERPH